VKKLISRQIDYKDIRPGDIGVCKGSGFIYNLFKPLLKVFFPYWDGWGWHTFFVAFKNSDGWQIFEELGTGADVSPLSSFENMRFYRWFEPDHKLIMQFILEYQGRKYDVELYFHTLLQYLSLRFLNIFIPKVKNKKYTCWELVCEFCKFSGKELVPDKICPLLPDMIKKLSI
jgi:hypothetical protein